MRSFAPVIIATTSLALALPTLAQVAWRDVLETKTRALETAARNAIDQQRRGHLPDHPLPDATWSAVGNVSIEATDEWDADGSGSSYRITVRDIGETRNHRHNSDRIEIRFDEPINVLEKGTGFALWVNAPAGLSEHLRVGVHLKIAGRDDDAIIFSDTPIVHRFGDNPHILYFDWGYVFDNSLGVFATPPREYFENVVGFDLTIVQKRIPFPRSRSLPATSGHFHLDGLAIVDYFDGSYDNARFPSADNPNADYPLVAQGRTQQVSLITAKFGGEEGIASAIRAMDMMARIQSWDGSWPEMRTRMQGEYTHGMIMADLARALRHMRSENRPELDETVTTRHWQDITRDELYEQMLYRSALSRSPAPFTEYDDSYTSRGGSLASGANRPMTYVLAQHIIANHVLTDDEQARHIMHEYEINVEEIVAAQGRYAGGWPIFGEGNRYSGEGLRWDSGYSTDHVAIMSNASRATDDPRWGEMLKRWSPVAEAMILPDGLRIDSGLSERGGDSPSGLKHADILFQEALRHDAPLMAQWGYNASHELWSNWPDTRVTLWPGVRHMSGYALGAFLTWQVYDMAEEPQPRDLGIRFPRQWPVWTANWFNKDREHVRTSRLIVGPAGIVNTFEWEVGQYPELTALPIMPTADDAAVEIVPLAYEGNVIELDAGTGATIATGPVDGQVSDAQPMRDDTATLALAEPTLVEIAAGDVTLRFNALPRGDGEARLTVRLLREVEPYEHDFDSIEAADADWPRPGTNLVDPDTGTRFHAINCFPNADYGIERALDDNAHTVWVIGQFTAGSGIRFEFRDEAPLEKLVLAQGDWRDSFHLAKEVTVRLADGTEQKLSLDEAAGEKVTLALDGVRSDSLTIMVDEIYERPDNAGNSGGWQHLEIIAAD